MRLKIASMLVLALVVAGCQMGITGSGVSKTEQRTVEDFDSVVLEGMGDVTIQVGAAKSVAVTFDDNLTEIVETSVQDGKLHINTSGSYSSKLGLKIAVTTPSLVSASVSGMGDITILDASGDELKLAIHGMGGITASGAVKSATVGVEGSGDAKLKDLIAENVTVTVSGMGGAEVHASRSVNAKTTGMGDIEIFGNPAEVQKSATGMGEVTLK